MFSAYIDEKNCMTGQYSVLAVELWQSYTDSFIPSIDI